MPKQDRATKDIAEPTAPERNLTFKGRGRTSSGALSMATQQQAHATWQRERGKHSPMGQVKWQQLGNRLFGFWGPVPTIVKTNTKPRNPTGVLGSPPILFVVLEVLGSSPWLGT